MKNCKHCNSQRLILSGIVNHKQRYQCKDCGKTSREGDKRVIHDMNKKIKVIKSYLEGVGIRSIARLEEVSPPMVIEWIRNFSQLLKNKLQNQSIPDNIKEIEILEVDELFSYCQKKLPKSTFGLLLIGAEIKLLISK